MRRTEEWTTDGAIRDAGWWIGTWEQFYALPTNERHDRAFAAMRCQEAAPTWQPQDLLAEPCSHIDCRIRRGELPPIAAANAQLRSEGESGWLRFLSRPEKARVYRALRRAARAQGIYDIWQLAGGWQTVVYTGVLGAKA